MSSLKTKSLRDGSEIDYPLKKSKWCVLEKTLMVLRTSFLHGSKLCQKDSNWERWPVGNAGVARDVSRRFEWGALACKVAPGRLGKLICNFVVLKNYLETFFCSHNFFLIFLGWSIWQMVPCFFGDGVQGAKSPALWGLDDEDEPFFHQGWIELLLAQKW